jgi:pimeloyl-ACP methyl ester carboxylesterase
MAKHPRHLGAQEFPWNQERAAYKSGMFKARDGQELFFCEEGEGKPDLVFVYGIGCSTLHWTYTIDYFSRTHRCLWFDYRGHQNSRAPSKPELLTVETFADDLLDFLSFADAKDAIVLGHSMGVSVALEAAHKDPYRMKALVLANGTPRPPLETMLGGNYLEPAFSLYSKLESLRPDLGLKLWRMQKASKLVPLALSVLGFNRMAGNISDIEQYARNMADADPHVFRQLMEAYQTYDATAWIHEVVLPTLVISGAQDLITPPKLQKLIAQLMPNADLVSIPGGSHCVPLDMPEVTIQEIETFLDRFKAR